MRLAEVQGEGCFSHTGTGPMQREAEGGRLGGRMQAIESLGWQRSAHAGGGMRRDYRDIHDLAVRNTSPHPKP